MTLAVDVISDVICPWTLIDVAGEAGIRNRIDLP